MKGPTSYGEPPAHSTGTVNRLRANREAPHTASREAARSGSTRNRAQDGGAHGILRQRREVVHSACPEVQETMKWSSPHFDYKGPMCGMSAFRQHCAFGFWKGSMVVKKASDEAMGQLGRITQPGDLPPRKTLTAWVRKAMKLNEDGVKAPRGPKPKKAEAKVPEDLRKAV